MRRSRNLTLPATGTTGIPQYACGMKPQEDKSVWSCLTLIVSLFVFVITPGVILAQQATPVPTSPASSSDELRVSAYTKREDLKLKVADLKAMPRTSVSVHNEHSKADEAYVSVRLADVLGKLGAPLGHDLRGVALSGYIVATGSDGYVAVIALAEVHTSFHSGEVIVADTMNGAPLDAKSGPFKLVVTEDQRPAGWVRNLFSIELKSRN